MPTNMFLSETWSVKRDIKYIISTWKAQGLWWILLFVVFVIFSELLLGCSSYLFLCLSYTMKQCLSLISQQAKWDPWFVLCLCQSKFEKAWFAPLQICLCLHTSSGSCLFLPSFIPCFRSCRKLRASNARTEFLISWEAVVLHSSALCHCQCSLVFQACILMTVLDTYLLPELSKSEPFSAT